MWFHFFLGNHYDSGKLTLQDMVQWFEAGLRELGHQVTIGDQLAPSAVNLIWEHFLTRKQAEGILESGVTFGLVGTEIPDGKGFNWRHFPPWPARWDAFQVVARGAAFIWSMIESSVPDYAQFAPTAYAELGFSDLLVPYESGLDTEFDFGFFGLMTPYRRAVLDKIGRHFKVAVPEGLLSPGDLRTFIARSRIGICFRQSPEWPIPSPTRLGRLLLARRGIAAESTPVTTRQSSLVPTAPTDGDFAEFCLSRLRANWKAEADEAFERYRATMPMRQIMERLLDQTVLGNVRVGNAGSHTPDDRRIGVKGLCAGEPPVVVAEYKSYNIVRCGDAFAAVSWRLGETCVQRFLDGTASPESATDFVVPLSPVEHLQHRIDLIEMTRSAQAAIELATTPAHSNPTKTWFHAPHRVGRLARRAVRRLLKLANSRTTTG
jgi:hypothetical protein